MDEAPTHWSCDSPLQLEVDPRTAPLGQIPTNGGPQARCLADGQVWAKGPWAEGDPKWQSVWLRGAMAGRLPGAFVAGTPAKYTDPADGTTTCYILYPDLSFSNGTAPGTETTPWTHTSGTHSVDTVEKQTPAMFNVGMDALISKAGSESGLADLVGPEAIDLYCQNLLTRVVANIGDPAPRNTVLDLRAMPPSVLSAEAPADRVHAAAAWAMAARLS